MVTWTVPELCGWENVVPTASLICLTCDERQPTDLDLSLPELGSSQEISFTVQLVADNNYTIEISATNACGNTTIRSCEGRQTKLLIILATFCNTLLIPFQPCVSSVMHINLEVRHSSLQVCMMLVFNYDYSLRLVN